MYMFGGEFTSRSQTQFYHYRLFRHFLPHHLWPCDSLYLIRDMWRLDLQTYSWEQVLNYFANLQCASLSTLNDE